MPCTCLTHHELECADSITVYRAESLQLQSQVADAHDEAQLLRRLLTLCNQALDTESKEGQAALAALAEDSRRRSSLEARPVDPSTVCESRLSVCMSYCQI